MTVSVDLRRRQLDGIESVIRLRDNHPSIEIKSAMHMIEGILSEQDKVEYQMQDEEEIQKLQPHYKGKYAIGKEAIERKQQIVELYKKGRATTIIADKFGITETRVYQILKEMGIPRNDGTQRTSIRDAIKEAGVYDKKYELIGQKAHSHIMKHKDNPWGIKVGTFQRCPICQKVGVVSLTIDSHPNDPQSFTYLYEQFTHSNKKNHQANLARVKGPKKYEWFADNIKEIKRTFRGKEI